MCRSLLARGVLASRLSPWFESGLLVSILIALTAPARAQGRDFSKTIAIVNLSASPSAPAAAALARKFIAQSPGLRATSSGDLARALEGALPTGGPDAPTLEAARIALRASDTAFGEFKSRLAKNHLNNARRLIFSLAPSLRTSKLLARVSFRLALIHLRANNQGLAAGEFQLQRRLDPQSAIDLVRFPPSVVQAFDKARAREPRKLAATLSISATYDGSPVYLDGKAVGPAPLSLAVAAGTHIVAVAAPQFQAAARALDIDPGDRQEIRIDLQPRSRVVRALALRYAARQRDFDSESLRSAAAEVSRLVGSDGVLIILGEKATAALYVHQLDRLSYRNPVDSSLSRMLALVLPVSTPVLVDGRRAAEPRSWYRNPIGIAAVASGLSLAIVGVLSLSSGDTAGPKRQGKPIWDF